jgi:NFU1 iron-sulfur cluster scaffold homolog, mitochondrial
MKELLKKILSPFAGKNTSVVSATENDTSLKQTGFQVIEAQPTPNPDAYRFQLNKPATEFDSTNFSSQDEASDDLFAKTVFNLYGVENVFIKDNFITITKSPVVGWGTLTGMVEKAVTSSLTFYQKKTSPDKTPLKEPSDNKEFSKGDFLKIPDSEKEKIVNAIFDQGVRPTLANDGGDLTLIDIRGEVIRIRYEGACGTCPSSTQGTLKFIEEMIQENLHPDLKVISI